MNMRVKPARRENQLLPSNHIGAAPDHEPRIHAIHNIWISCLPDPHNQAVLDPHIGFENARPIHHQSIRHHGIQALGIRHPTHLPHALANRLAPPERTLVAIPREVMLHPDPQIRGPEAHHVARRGAEHADVRRALHARAVDVHGVGARVRGVAESALLQPLRHGLGVGGERRHGAVAHAVAPAHPLPPADFDQRHRLRVARLEPYRRARGNVEAVAARFNAVEVEEGVRLGEVIVRTDLFSPYQSSIPNMLCALQPSIPSPPRQIPNH